MEWDGMKFWESKDWVSAQDKMDNLKIKGFELNPTEGRIWSALDNTPLGTVKVMLCGQDPYPDLKLATGMAFHIPLDAPYVPPTLNTILKELKSDLDTMVDGRMPDLRLWVDQGVLLWNVIPVTVAGQSLTCDWPEWESLNTEMIKLLEEQGCVFVFLGGVARRYASLVDQTTNGVVEASHPSPRASRAAKHPFLGSRLFSTINAKLVEQGLNPVDWRL